MELSLNKESDKAYKEMIFDWTKEIAGEIFHSFELMEQGTRLRPWQKRPRLKMSRYSKSLPRSAEELSGTVMGVMRGGEGRRGRERLVSRKKMDRVDALLLAEMYEEEADWIDYDKEEDEVKMELAESVWDDLIKDAIEDVVAARNAL